MQFIILLRLVLQTPAHRPPNKWWQKRQPEVPGVTEEFFFCKPTTKSDEDICRESDGRTTINLYYGPPVMIALIREPLEIQAELKVGDGNTLIIADTIHVTSEAELATKWNFTLDNGYAGLSQVPAYLQAA